MKTTLPRRSPLKRRLPSGLLAIGALAVQMPATAYLVTNSADGGPGSLRDALNAAVPAIEFSSNLLCHRIYLTNELVVGHDVVINGLGPAFLALDGNYDVLTNLNENHRIFHILPGRTVTISNLSMINARVYDQSFAFGGAILNEGALTLDNCAVKGNLVSSAGASWGGAIYSSGGSLLLRNCSLTGNAASSSYTLGGGIFNRQGNGGRDGVLFMANCTVSGNTATAAAVPDISVDEIAMGGGIYNAGFTTVFVNCTICSNSAWSLGRLTNSDSRGGGLYVDNGASMGERCTLRNTLVAGNSARIFNSAAEGPDVWGTVTSYGINLIGITNGSTGWGPADIVGGLLPANTPVDPKLGPLGYYGGQTLCHSLLPESQAIDHGDDSVVDGPPYLTTDQRGVQLGTIYARKVNAHVDIGAFETNKPTYYVFGCVALPDFAHTPRDLVVEMSDGDTMKFDPGLGGTYVADGELVIDKSINIVGPGAALLTLSGDGSNRVFHVTSNATVNISGLTIANGISSSGGGILNEGTLQVSDCLLASNQASSLGGFGGGIYSSGNLTVSGSTFLSNSAAFGGGLANAGVLNLFNSTFTSNSAISKGGALYQFGTAALLQNCTVASNTAFDGGAGLGCDIGSAVPDLQNCLVAGNIGFVPDAYGIFHSLGYNLIGAADPNFTVGFGTNGDQIGTPSSPLDALLGPLQDNGGPTPTMALLAGSPAINLGYSPSLLLDQRGGRRPVYATAKLAAGDGSDIGAYEADSLLRIKAIEVLAPTGINISFWSEMGSSYWIEQSPTLWPGTWTSLTNNIAGTGGIMHVTDPDPMQPQRFYRVRLLP